MTRQGDLNKLERSIIQVKDAAQDIVTEEEEGSIEIMKKLKRFEEAMEFLEFLVLYMEFKMLKAVGEDFRYKLVQINQNGSANITMKMYETKLKDTHDNVA